MIRIEPMRPDDWEAVRAIYAEGIATGDATFETAPADREDWDRDHLGAPRLVAKDDGEIIGWVALGPGPARRAYRGVAEVTLYVAARHRRRGAGRALLDALIAASERAGLWTLQAGIFPENRASLELHRACGFREVGVRERIGKRDGRWRDVVLLERRSRTVGTD